MVTIAEKTCSCSGSTFIQKWMCTRPADCCLATSAKKASRQSSCSRQYLKTATVSQQLHECVEQQSGQKRRAAGRQPTPIEYFETIGFRLTPRLENDEISFMAASWLRPEVTVNSQIMASIVYLAKQSFSFIYNRLTDKNIYRCLSADCSLDEDDRRLRLSNADARRRRRWIGELRMRRNRCRQALRRALRGDERHTQTFTYRRAADIIEQLKSPLDRSPAITPAACANCKPKISRVFAPLTSINASMASASRA